MLKVTTETGHQNSVCTCKSYRMKVRNSHTLLVCTVIQVTSGATPQWQTPRFTPCLVLQSYFSKVFSDFILDSKLAGKLHKFLQTIWPPLVARFITLFTLNGYEWDHLDPSYNSSFVFGEHMGCHGVHDIGGPCTSA